MKLTKLKLTLGVVILLLAVTFLGGSAFWTTIGLWDDQSIEGTANIVRDNAGKVGENWSQYGGDKGGNRYVSADQINAGNVADLKIAWTHRSGTLDNRGDALKRVHSQATPILVEDSLIFCTPFSQAIAVDPGTGEEKWRFEPKIALDANPANGYSCRGVSYWQDSQADDAVSACTSRIFFGTVDARIIALDAKSGKPCQDFGEAGAVQIQPSLALRWPGEFQITSAPAIIGDVVVTGTSIGDNLRTDAPKGTVYGLDARTGETRWTFDPLADDTQTPTGHANVWSTMAVDEQRGLVFLPTSSASPDYFGGNRPGDNLYANSVVALDGANGEVAWHYQIVHHDVWDYDLPAQPGLYQVWREGKAHDVVAQVTKTGHVFVLDRETGQPFLPIEERAVPQSGSEGEPLSPTQPFPVKTPALVPDRVDPWDAFGITLWDRWACRNQIAGLRAEGLYTPPSLEGTMAMPFTGGGANWGSAAFDPQRNMLVINMSNVGSYVRLHPGGRDKAANEVSHDDEFAPMEGSPYGMSRNALLSPLGLPCTPPPWGIIAGVDLDSGEIIWRRPFGTTEDLAGGLALGLGTPNFGGPIVTAGGLVFIGAAMDNYLRAFDSNTGEELWKGRLPAGGQATPMSYTWQGKQYVVIVAGGHARAGTKLGDYLVAFALE